VLIRKSAALRPKVPGTTEARNIRIWSQMSSKESPPGIARTSSSMRSGCRSRNSADDMAAQNT